jgi:DNA mismatch repair protein MLH3
MSITSHHHLHHSHNTLIINRSQVIARHTPAPPQHHNHSHKHGTRVAVRDLFGNMPVRVKQRIEESSKLSGSGREWEELRKLVTSLVLAWPSPVTIVVRDGVSGQKVQLRGQRPLSSLANTDSEAKLVAHVCNTLSQAMFVSSPDQSKWVSTRASTLRIRIRGAISLEPAPTRAAQFLSLGIEPLSIQYGHSVLYDEINRLFENSSFGNEAESSGLDATETRWRYEDRRHKSTDFTNKELRGTRKGFDRWPMFFIKIDFLDPVTDRVEVATVDLVEDKKGSLISVVELLQAMVLEFLRSHHFRPKSTRSTRIPQNRDSETVRNLPEGSARAERGYDLETQSLKPVQAQRIGSPFNTWSRVKSGRPKPASSIPEQFYEPKNMVFQGEIKSPMSSASISKINIYLSSSPDPNNPALENDTPTISRSGKVIRPPFSGLQQATSKTVSAPLSFKNDPSIPPGSNRTNGEEEFVNWVNPITKIGSLVNSRTGLVTHSSKTERLTPRIFSYLEPESKSDSLITEHIALDGNPNSIARSSTWISDVLRSWDNPVYRPTATSIPQVSLDGPENESQQLLHGRQHNCSKLDITRAFQESSAGLGGRVSKEALRHADVISQVDRKFILIKISASTVSSGDDNTNGPTEILVIVDQHAADERCRVEDLLGEICSAPVVDERLENVASVQPGVLTTPLEKPISFVMPRREIQLLRTHSQHFVDWGIIYDLPPIMPTVDQHGEYKVTVKSLPPLIIERCTAVPRLLVELLRSEAWKYSEKGSKLENIRTGAGGIDTSAKHPWLKKIHSCPQALLEMLNSRACRSKIKFSDILCCSKLTSLGAIMFSDELSNDQCKALISRLANCAFPFQCAHGRPSMIPLLSLDSFTQECISNERANLQQEAHFGAALKRWKHGMASFTES